ncbi:hypothetical protein [Microbacterium sp. 77mftsu3.1]|uniref:hypothetical protein n=1 Tax=Microbacterium sp. 77mftsu3.1 TaxID=1761802 RepID=UPI00037CBD43|nr:hypothetical protein [Microbacterium sp. 77mftsu3.1]
MTDINTAAEAAREDHRDRSNGQFGQQHHTAPEATIAVRPRPVVLTGRYTPSTVAPVPYPTDIPPGGEVEVDIEDMNGRAFVSITFGPEATGGEEVRISLGGSAQNDDRWNTLNELDFGEYAFDAATDDAVLEYLEAVRSAVDDEVERAKYAVLNKEVLGDIAARTTTAPEPTDHSDEATEALAAKKGETLVNLFGHEDEELISNAADAIADIVRFYASKGGDVDELWAKAELYARTEEEDAAINGVARELDWWVDGHCISATTADAARAAVRAGYGHEAEEVRRWTAEDQAELDENDEY